MASLFPLGTNMPGFPLTDDDKKMALANALMGAGGSILAAAGPSRNPVGFGQAVGPGLASFMGSYQQSLGNATAEKLKALQLQQAQQQVTKQATRQKALDTLLSPQPQPFDPMTEITGGGAAPPAPPSRLAQLAQSFGLGEDDMRLALTGDDDFLTKVLVAKASAAKAPSSIQEYELAKSQGFQGSFQDWEKSKQSPPSEVQEYQFAQSQGFKGTFQEFQIEKRRAGATNVTVSGAKYGQIPPDYQLVEGPTGAWLEVIPGSKTAKAEESRGQQRRTTTDIVSEDVDRIIERAESSAVPVTGIWSLAKALPASAAGDINRLLETIKANAGLDKLQALREASPTGGALGPVSDFENKLLQATIGNLEQSQSDKQFFYNLRRVKDVYQDIVHGPGNRPGSKPQITPEQALEELKRRGVTK